MTTKKRETPSEQSNKSYREAVANGTDHAKAAEDSHREYVEARTDQAAGLR